MAKFISPVDEEMLTEWVISIDDASDMKGIRGRIVLEEPENILIEQALKFKFTVSNNQTEYEDLIAGMILALEIGASKLKAKIDSQLIANQVFGKYQAIDPQLIWHLQKVWDLSYHFSSFEIKHAPIEQSLRENLLPKLAT